MNAVPAQWRRRARLSYLLSVLLVPITLWQLQFSPLWLAVLALLLLLPARGLLRGKPYTHAWACFILILELGVMLMQVIGPQRNAMLALLIAALLSYTLYACAMYARHAGRALGLGLKNKPKDLS